MLAGYGRYANDNVRTKHLKCSGCNTRTYLIKIERDDIGREIRSFACQHCAAISALHLPSPTNASKTPIGDFGGN